MQIIIDHLAKYGLTTMRNKYKFVRNQKLSLQRKKKVQLICSQVLKSQRDDQVIRKIKS